MNETSNKKKKKKKGGFMGYIFGGRFFGSEIFLNNALLLGMIVLYAFIYVSNRYAFQQELREIEHLKKVRLDLRYDLLTRQSEFSDKSRQSNIEKYIKENNSELKTATQPPYSID
ncbi:MAG: hypothetical protein IKB11_03130 [Bacteroidaceae bacterium]|mgnify:FL=1|nr:hypothetical protein [Bacteroidaceae bacterium]MBR2415729.1 hypothetical protein [Bacteroidaceae bacterium]